MFIMLEVKASVHNYRPGSEQCIINLSHNWVVIPLATEAGVEAKIKLGEYEYQVFVKSVKD